MRRLPHSLLVPTAALAVAALGAVGCAANGAGDAERFCGEILANRDELISPTLEYTDDVEPLLDLYRRIGDLAPLAIEPAWDQLTLNYETASPVVPDDADSVQRAVRVAYESEKSAVAVSRWLSANCGVDIGPVATIVAQP